MTEAYLQFIWAQKRIPIVNAVLTDGRKLLIHDVGEHNEHLSGPDFSLGSITIDGVRLYGNIEIHVRSSDWERHGHQNDPAYQSVILHVVFEDDQPLIIEGQRVPTLELKNHIDKAHYARYLKQQIRKEVFPCASELKELSGPHFEFMKSRALYAKLEAKRTHLQELNPSDRFNVFYQCVGAAFGMSVNRMAFETLVRRVPLYALKGLSPKHKYQLLLVESGIVQFSDSAQKQHGHLWNYRGTRPGNFPEVRLRQFAHLASRYDFDSMFVHFDGAGIENYFRKVLAEIWEFQHDGAPRLSKGFVDHLLINAVVPFLWYCAQRYEDDELTDKALDLLSRLPAEKNTVIRCWNKAGITASSAYDSQALLALHAQYCCHKKCLSCEVGNKVLNRVK